MAVHLGSGGSVTTAREEFQTKWGGKNGFRLKGHALLRRDEPGFFKAECSCGAQSYQSLPTGKRRSEWQRDHIHNLMITQATAKPVKSAELLKIAQITFRQLDHWTRKGYLRTLGPEGSGTHRLWTEDEKLVAVAMSRLISVGFAVEEAAILARRHVEHPSKDGAYLLTHGVEVRFTA